MTSYLESDFRKVVCAELRTLNVHMVAIESRTYPGIPDINYCHRGIEGWIELKMVRGNTLRHPMTAQQRNWIRSRRNEDGRIFILTREFRGKGQGNKDQVTLYDGAMANTLNDIDVSEPGDHALLILQKPFNWRILLTVITD